MCAIGDGMNVRRNVRDEIREIRRSNNEFIKEWQRQEAEEAEEVRRHPMPNAGGGANG